MAFGSTSVSAQVADTAPPAPAVVAPAPEVAAPPAASAPAAPAPATVAPTMTSTPMVQQVPSTPAPVADAPAAAAPAAATPARRATATPAARPVARTATRSVAAAAPVAVPTARTITPPPPATPVDRTPAIDTPPATTPSVSAGPVAAVDHSSRDMTGPTLGLLALLGLAGGGALLMRRRRPLAEDAGYEEPVYEPVSAAEPEMIDELVAPAAMAPAAMVAPAAIDRMDDTDELRAPAAPAYAYADDAEGEEALAQTDAEAVPTGDARQALLDEMVAAEPDEANPFRSPTARRRRARLILQKLEHDQQEASNAPFDWRTYSAPQPAAGETAPQPNPAFENTEA